MKGVWILSECTVNRLGYKQNNHGPIRFFWKFSQIKVNYLATVFVCMYVCTYSSIHPFIHSFMHSIKSPISKMILWSIQWNNTKNTNIIHAIIYHITNLIYAHIGLFSHSGNIQWYNYWGKWGNYYLIFFFSLHLLLQNI